MKTNERLSLKSSLFHFQIRDSDLGREFLFQESLGLKIETTSLPVRPNSTQHPIKTHALVARHRNILLPFPTGYLLQSFLQVK
jgi:hypothetical protein